MPERFPPDEPREWLNRARSDLKIAQSYREGIYLEDLCFHAQQAAEKAIKAVYVRFGWTFRYTQRSELGGVSDPAVSAWTQIGRPLGPPGHGP